MELSNAQKYGCHLVDGRCRRCGLAEQRMVDGHCMYKFNPMSPDCTLKPKEDRVNHPAHYTSDPSGVECIQITQHRNFCIGNAIKYLWRAGLKGDSKVEDLKKAVWYINKEIERLSDG